ncbi:MAG: hypothetical protein ISR55_06600 [Bacteroidetes bacterium]|nr:hypothetical protein [Bacteroidota bacterium]
MSLVKDNDWKTSRRLPVLPHCSKPGKSPAMTFGTKPNRLNTNLLGWDLKNHVWELIAEVWKFFSST